MCKQHLNALSVMARSLERLGLGQRPGNVTSLLVNATRDPAERCLWTALRLEQAGTTVARACQIKKCFPVIDQFAGRGELSLSETYALKYWWCSPPRTGTASVRPPVWTARGIGASLCSDRCWMWARSRRRYGASRSARS